MFVLQTNYSSYAVIILMKKPCSFIFLFGYLQVGVQEKQKPPASH